VRHVTLKVPLRAFAVVGRGHGHHAAHAWVQTLGDAFNYAAFARCVTAFKQDDDFLFFVCHPVLQLDQLALEFEQFAEIGHSPVLVGIGVACAQRFGGIGQVPILDFEFQFFVVAVHQVAFNAFEQFVVVFGGVHAG